MASIKLAGDTSGEITISAPAVAGTTTLTLPATSSTLATQNALGVRNLIINGDMRIDQRNAGASVNPTNDSYVLDRWQHNETSSNKYSVQQNAGSVTPPDTFINYMGCTSLSAYTLTATDTFTIKQNIEGLNTTHLAWGTANAKTVTLSFWVRSSLTGTFGGSFRNSSSSRCYPFSYTISSANTWEKKTITVLGDTTGTWLTNTSTGITILFSLGTGSTYSGTAGSWTSSTINSVTGATSVVGTSGATFYITGVQLEVGDTATPFEHRPYDMELQRCMRYYELINDSNYNSYGVMSGGTSQFFAGCIDYKTIKRATPTITITGSFLIQGNSNQPGTTGMGTQGIGKRSVYISGTGAGSNVVNGYSYNLLDVNGYIKVDAEI